MHRYLLIVLVFVLSSFQVSVLSFTDMHVMKAAEGQLGVFTARIPPGDANLHGFRQEDDMEQLEVGKPYRILEFNTDFYDNELGEDRNYIIIKSEWRVPVSSKGENRVMLTVKGISGNFSVTHMGDTSLARELQHKTIGMNDSDEYYLLQVPVLSATFLGHEASGSFSDAEFIPLSSAAASIASISTARRDSYTLGDVQKMVKEELARRNKKEPEVTAPPQIIPKKKQKTKSAPAIKAH
jgi:hypothetical protein